MTSLDLRPTWVACGRARLNRLQELLQTSRWWPVSHPALEAVYKSLGADGCCLPLTTRFYATNLKQHGVTTGLAEALGGLIDVSARIEPAALPPSAFEGGISSLVVTPYCVLVRV